MFRGRHRGLPLIALVALLLGVVAWAAHGTTTGGTDAGTSPAVSPSVASSVLNLVVAAAWGATIVVLIYLAVTVRRRRDEFEDPENQQVVKAWWLPWVAMLIIIATVAAGAGSQLQVWHWTIHLTLATLTLLINLWAFRVEFRNVSRNAVIINEVMAEGDRIRAERGLPSNAEALQEEEVR